MSTHAADSFAGWTVRSHVPGRLRAHHPVLRRSTPVGEQICLRMLAIEGVSGCAHNPITSRILLLYDANAIAEGDALRLLRDAGEAALEGPDIESTELVVAGELSRRLLPVSTINLGVAAVAVWVPRLRSWAWWGALGASAPIFWRALRAIFVRREIKVDILDAIVAIMLLAGGWTFAAALMVWLLELADSILESTSQSSRALIGGLFGARSRHAWRLSADGTQTQVHVRELRIGDVVIVRTGEQIPVDGLVRDGEAMVDQHVLTGEHSPVDRAEGEPVFGMTNVLAGQLAVEVRETADSSNAARVVSIIQHAMEHRVRLQYVSERFADRMVVPTLGIGALGYYTAGTPALIAILNADYGTGIRVACPLALVASLAVAARHGIVIKNGKVLETIRDIDAVVFDKTGTLTRDVPEVAEVRSYGRTHTPDDVLALAAAAERRSSHPIARAILQRAESSVVPLPPIDESTLHVGFGIQVAVGAEMLRVGSPRFMDREGVRLGTRAKRDLEHVRARGESAVLVALDQQVVGAIELRAAERDEAFDVIATLKERRGIRELFLVSGDEEAPTRAVAHRLGIDHYRAEMQPDQKAQHIRDLQARGLRVAMVGDGINDTIALATADCSISLSGAADIAMDAADIVFVNGDFRKFDLLFELSVALNRNVRRSFAMTMVPNSVLIVGALGGWFGIGASIVLNNTFNLLATLNGLLPYLKVRQATDVDMPGVLDVSGVSIGAAAK